jgi:hypothetical protein
MVPHVLEEMDEDDFTSPKGTSASVSALPKTEKKKRYSVPGIDLATLYRPEQASPSAIPSTLVQSTMF